MYVQKIKGKTKCAITVQPMNNTPKCGQIPKLDDIVKDILV